MIFHIYCFIISKYFTEPKTEVVFCPNEFPNDHSHQFYSKAARFFLHGQFAE